MSEVFKLSDVKKPVFQVEVTAGDVREYDPFALVKKLEALQASAPATGNTGAMMDGIRLAFGIPTLEDFQCLALLKGVHAFIKDVAELKNG